MHSTLVMRERRAHLNLPKKATNLVQIAHNTSVYASQAVIRMIKYVSIRLHMVLYPPIG